ncbi:UbiA family prenyltransferase [Nonomuraea sp. NPDC050783]|uniref:UbiA family prenyltransferase n=1 Tax=Nonomuraea sp. NPDC050783 TaxID=3154634 RepID=UPI003465EDBA
MRQPDSSAAGTTPASRLLRALHHELQVTWRMVADNLPGAVVPPLVIALAVCLRDDLPLSRILWHEAEIVILSFCYIYVFDSSNQARSGDEDRLNKPYRPIPAGLLTPLGAWRRFWCVMPLYTLLGWRLGVVEWVLLFQAGVILMNMVCTPRLYLWCKTPFNMAAGVAQLAVSWQVVSPLDGTAWRWFLTIGATYPLAIIFEDLRDVEGDRAVGRRTPALVLGAWPVRVWFAVLMGIFPVLGHLLLFAPTGAPFWRIVLVDSLYAAMCWATGARALLFRHAAADRITYQMFITGCYPTVLISGLILWS